MNSVLTGSLSASLRGTSTLVLIANIGPSKKRRRSHAAFLIFKYLDTVE